mgnify:CR=1 FL=1
MYMFILDINLLINLSYLFSLSCFCYLGGGASGIAARAPTTALACKLCKTPIHNLTIMRTHYTAKHPTATFSEADYPTSK